MMEGRLEHDPSKWNMICTNSWIASLTKTMIKSPYWHLYNTETVVKNNWYLQFITLHIKRTRPFIKYLNTCYLHMLFQVKARRCITIAVTWWIMEFKEFNWVKLRQTWINVTHTTPAQLFDYVNCFI